MTDKPMVLQTLTVYREYGQTGYRIRAEFVGAHKVELHLPSELGDKVLRICLDMIVEQIQFVAANATPENLLNPPTNKELEAQP